MRRKVRWSWRVSALLMGMFLLGGSAAVASIPQGNTINACRNAQTGALRVIDPSLGQKCAAGEVFLSWNRWHWRSIWLPKPQYFVGDVVSSGGSSYIARLKPPIGALPTNTSYWSLVASKGAIGLRGLPGIPGVKGATGLVGAVGATGVQGLQGLAGADGLPGLAGATGLTGLTGVQGLPGLAGATGVQGLQGLVGPTGVQGLQGLAGATGVQGLPGLVGPTGVQGLQGLVGPTGVQGLQGLVGPTGVQGLPGLAGATGVQGLQGLVGPTGVQGLQGLVGATGSQGLPGLAGSTGSQGLPGLAGSTGSQGLPGLAGSTGSQGIPGIPGATGVVDAIFAKVNSNGTLAYGKHVSSTSSTGGLLPTYTINFDQNVSQCVVNAVSEGAVAIPVITVHGTTSISMTLSLLTGILTPSAFDVTVTC